MACSSCEYIVYDKIRDIDKCLCTDKMTLKEYDKYFADRAKDCPYYKERVEKGAIAV